MARELPPPVTGVTGLSVRTPTLPPATHTNCWVLGGALAVDPASPWLDEQAAVASFLEERPVRAIVLTHHHPDHVGGAEALREATGAPVLAHAETARRLPFEIDREVAHGDVLGGWTALHTPGHAPGHLCLHRDGVVVAGDMVAGIGTILLEPPEGDLQDYLDSLELLRGLGPDLLLPAHGPAIEDAVGYLEHYIDHRHERTAQVRATLAEGPARPVDLVPQVYAEVPGAFWPMAARQVLCHLLWLEARGEVANEGEVFMLSGRRGRGRR